MVRAETSLQAEDREGKGGRWCAGNVGSQGPSQSHGTRCAQTRDPPEAALTHQTDFCNLPLSEVPTGAPGSQTPRWPLLCHKGLGGFFLSLHRRLQRQKTAS